MLTALGLLVSPVTISLAWYGGDLGLPIGHAGGTRTNSNFDVLGRPFDCTQGVLFGSRVEQYAAEIANASG
jgi:hypothetical protein